MDKGTLNSLHEVRYHVEWEILNQTGHWGPFLFQLPFKGKNKRLISTYLFYFYVSYYKSQIAYNFISGSDHLHSRRWKRNNFLQIVSEVLEEEEMSLESKFNTFYWDIGIYSTINGSFMILLFQHHTHHQSAHYPQSMSYK